MKRLFAFTALVFILAPVVSAQISSESKVVCKDSPVPEGYVIVGETQVKECTKQAWVVQKRRTPKMTNDGVVGNLNRTQIQGMESPLEKLLSPGASSNDTKAAKPVPTSQWKKIFPAKDEFSVLLPTTPEHYDGEKVGAPLDIYMAAAGNDRYILMSMKAPSEMNDGQRQQALSGFSAGFMSSMQRHQNNPFDNTRLTFDKDINIMGLVGKQFSIESTEGKGAFRVYVSKQRLYFLGAVGSSKSDVYKFLDSFKLVTQ